MSIAPTGCEDPHVAMSIAPTGREGPRFAMSIAPTGREGPGVAMPIAPTEARRSARHRRRVAFARAADLVRTLVEARGARELGRAQRRLDRVDVLILDEVGFVPFDRAGGELLFNVIASRYERRSVLVTTNLAFSEWPKVFGGDEKLTTALLDRLARHAVVITTKGKSFRMRKRTEPVEDASTKATKSGKTR